MIKHPSNFFLPYPFSFLLSSSFFFFPILFVDRQSPFNHVHFISFSTPPPVFLVLIESEPEGLDLSIIDVSTRIRKPSRGVSRHEDFTEKQRTVGMRRGKEKKMEEMTMMKVVRKKGRRRKRSKEEQKRLKDGEGEMRRAREEAEAKAEAEAREGRKEERGVTVVFSLKKKETNSTVSPLLAELNLFCTLF